MKLPLQICARRHRLPARPATTALAALALGLAVLLLPGCNRRVADHTRGVSAVCRLHGTHMAKTNVPIVYGLIRLNEWGKALATASSNSFPNAEQCWLGGCIIEAPKEATIYICPECQQARRDWELKHPEPRM